MRMPLNDSDMKLANALEVWLAWACATIKERQSELVDLIGMPRWEVLPGGGFRRYPYFATYRNPILEAAVFSSNNNWIAVVQASEDHAKMRQHVNVLICAPDGDGSSFSMQELCRTILPKPILVSENKVHIETEIDIENCIFDFIQEINSELLPKTTIWPVWGISVDAPVALDDSTEFRELSDEEKKHVINFNILDVDIGDIITPDQSKWFGLCRKMMPKKLFGRYSLSEFDFQSHYVEMEQTLEDFLVCVPLIKNRLLYHAGGLAKAPHIEFGLRLTRGVVGISTGSSNRCFLLIENEQRLNNSEIDKLREIWSLIRESNDNAFRRRVINAARRLYYAETRVKKEDALIDLMISAESLYLSTDQNELSYRIALNAALWSDVSINERHNVYLEFKKAYGLRSKLVHGSTASPKDITAAIAFVKPVILNAVRKAFDQLGQNASVPDWEKMILESKGIGPLIDTL